MSHLPQHRVGRRMKALREQGGLTQDALAKRMGLKHRQTLQSIEGGERAIRPEELMKAAAALGVDISELTDPFRLVGEGSFSFRAEGVPKNVLAEFQRTAGTWVATYRSLVQGAGDVPTRVGVKLELDPRSTFEDAHAAAEEIRTRWALGTVPAEALAGAIERELHAQVLFVDAPAGLSGAAVHLPGTHTILINRNDPPGRRHFDLAHELFHILTWDVMKPKLVESRTVPRTKGNRVERLADNFAGALLMPEDVVASFWQRRGDAELHDWLNATATTLRVSSVALKWRLVVLRHITAAEATALDDGRLAGNGGMEEEPPPLPFSREFVTRVYHAVEAGRLSLRKAAGLLGMPVTDFAQLCRAYRLELSYEV